MTFWAGVVSLFPDMFAALTEYGVTGRAFRAGLVQMETWNPRNFTADRHQTVDERPYGGGPGMVMKVEPLRDASRAAKRASGGASVVCLSPAGRLLDQQGVRELVARERLVLVAGRYEGIDQRVLDAEVDEEWSIGDYVLSGGELAVMVMLDAIIRQVPGALGNEESEGSDSFADGLLEYPQYTRPEELDGMRVPEVLLSGNHALIERWRRKQSLGRTWERRPELLEGRDLDADARRLLDEYRAEQADAGAGRSRDG